MSSNTIAVYANGLFSTNEPSTNDPQLAQLQASRFNSFLLFALHVQQNGDLHYNDTPIVTGGQFNGDMAYMASYVQSLPGQVLWSLGGWGVSDFQNIGQLLQTADGKASLGANLQALLTGIPATGFDLDMEESYSDAMRETVVGFTNLVGGELGATVTYCPYQQQDFWEGCLADVFEINGSQLVQRYNLQCYAGGTGNTTAGWLSGLKSSSRALGIPDLDGFILPSNWVQSDDGSQKNSPADLQAFFARADIREGAGGGFLWNTAEIFGSSSTAADYSQAVVKGLEGSS